MWECDTSSDVCWGCLVAGRRMSSLRRTGMEDEYARLLSEIPQTELDSGAVLVCWECRSLLRRLHHFKRQVETSYRTLRDYLQHEPYLANVSAIAQPSRLVVQTVCRLDYPYLPAKADVIGGEDFDAIKNEYWDVPTVLQSTANLNVDFIKTEQEDDLLTPMHHVDDHSEPDTFANALSPESPRPASADGAERAAHTKTEEPPGDERKGKRKHKKERKKPKVKTRKKKLSAKIEKPERKMRSKKSKPVTKDDVSADLEGSSDGLSDLESVIDYYNDPPVISKDKPVKKAKDVPYDPEEIKLITLTHEEMLKEREREALADYFVKSTHKCNDCILGFKYERTLKTHLETKHDESAGEHLCAVCLVRFTSADEYTEHARRHLQRYKCNVCGKKSPTLLPMLKHCRNHKEYKCELCGSVSGSLFRHQTHMAKEHKEKPQCAECNKLFSSRKTYRYHMNVIHKGQNRFPCPHCGKIYQWKSNLWRHIKNHKARDTGELYCAPCDKKFSSIATYQQHLKVSRKHVTENEFNYRCEECGKKFANKTRLKDHVDWEHLKKINYRCQICNKPFKSNTSLYVHMQNVHKNKDEKDNLCHVCGKSYQNIAKLKYHIVAMHTTETPYNCEQCPSAFSWYSSLYRHVKEVHEKVRLKKKRVRRKDTVTPAAPPHMPLHTTLHHM